MRIESIEFMILSDYDKRQVVSGNRRLIVKFDDGVTITYGPLYDGWVNIDTQGRSTVDHTWIGVEMADRFNDWLHGEDDFRIDV